MNALLPQADRATHIKIVALALAGGVAVALVGLSARQAGDPQATRPVAGLPPCSAVGVVDGAFLSAAERDDGVRCAPPRRGATGLIARAPRTPEPKPFRGVNSSLLDGRYIRQWSSVGLTTPA